MSRSSVFGWDLPPGVTSKMIDDLSAEGPCAVCNFAVDDCTCQECPVCNEQGNPDCQAKHGLVLSPDQKICSDYGPGDEDYEYDRSRED